MVNSVFREKQETNSVEVLPEGKNPDITQIDDGVDVPYTDYKKIKGHPYLSEYFDLGDVWDNFSEDIDVLDSYIKTKIYNGDIANSKGSVLKEIKQMEKITNIKDEERPIVRMGILKEYINFLNNSRQIKKYAI